MMDYPSIFNDVLGPVMRGPSSSHCAASLRIGRIARDLMDGQLSTVLIEFDPNGSLASTHDSQGSDMGLFGGFLGWEAHDERLPNYREAIREAEIDIQIEVVEIAGAEHPNTYKLSLYNKFEKHRLIALSTGGGMIEIIDIDGTSVSMGGDFYETLVYVNKPTDVLAFLNANINYDEMAIRKGEEVFIQIKSQSFLSELIIQELSDMEAVEAIKQIAPVLPVLSRKNLSVPFITAKAMLAYNKGRGLELWELALHYESERGALRPKEVWEKMRNLVHIMSESIQEGLKGTEYDDRILGVQSLHFQEQMQAKKLVGGDVLNTIILFATSIMEVKNSMGVIVAAPTAGACAALPAACRSLIKVDRYC